MKKQIKIFIFVKSKFRLKGRTKKIKKTNIWFLKNQSLILHIINLLYFIVSVKVLIQTKLVIKHENKTIHIKVHKILT